MRTLNPLRHLRSRLLPLGLPLGLMLVGGGLGSCGGLESLPPGSSEMGEAMPRHADAVARFAGVDVVYTDTDPGSGRDAIVLVHGWASGRVVWEEHVARLGRRHRVLAVDLPGHGDSGSPPLAYPMDFQADAVASVMTHAGAGRGVMVGHSNGTPVVRQFYRRHPQRTLGLVAVDGTLVGGMVSEGMVEAAMSQLQAPGFRETLMGFVRPMLSPRLTKAQRERVIGMMDAVPQHVLVATLRSANDPAIWVEDPIEAPLLVILARAPMWNLRYRQRVAALSPRADVHTFGDVTHLLFMDDPDAFQA